jgi:DNA-binding transcriptional ArsR family regulator
MLIATDPQPRELPAKMFRGFSDPSGLSTLAALRGGVLSADETADATGLSQSYASDHLGCLRECGLVTAEPQARFVYYGLSDECVAQLLWVADELVANVARGLYQTIRTAPEGASDGQA